MKQTIRKTAYQGTETDDVWETALPISELPAPLRDMYRGYARFLLGELYANTPSVVLADAPDPRHSGHKVRRSLNPKWYVRLYRTTSYCKRQRVLNALTRIADGNDRQFRSGPFRYDTTIRDVITEIATQGLEDYDVPPSNVAREFFGLSPLEEALEKTGTDSTENNETETDEFPF